MHQKAALFLWYYVEVVSFVLCIDYALFGDKSEQFSSCLVFCEHHILVNLVPVEVSQPLNVVIYCGLQFCGLFIISLLVAWLFHCWTESLAITSSQGNGCKQWPPAIKRKKNVFKKMASSVSVKKFRRLKFCSATKCAFQLYPLLSWASEAWEHLRIEIHQRQH